MSFHLTLFDHVRDATTKLLRSCNFTREYYIDRVQTVLHPDIINIVAYAKTVGIMKKYLIDNGFTVKITKDPESITMTYRDIVNIKIMANKKDYEACKVINFRISSITLDHVIREMSASGYNLSQMYTKLTDLAKYKKRE